VLDIEVLVYELLSVFRDPPIPMPSRRRMSWNVLQSLTDKQKTLSTYYTHVILCQRKKKKKISSVILCFSNPSVFL